jgi:hypothetical protein
MVNTVEQPLDISNPDNKILLSLYLSIPEVENDKISLRTDEGSCPVFTEPVQLILRISEVLGSSQKAQEVNFDLLCLWVPRTDKGCNLLEGRFIFFVH